MINNKKYKNVISLLFALTTICSSYKSYADSNDNSQMIIESFSKENPDILKIKNECNKGYSISYYPKIHKEHFAIFSVVNYDGSEEGIMPRGWYCNPSVDTCDVSFNLDKDKKYDSIKVKIFEEVINEDMIEFDPYISKNILTLKNIQKKKIEIQKIYTDESQIEIPNNAYPIIIDKESTLDINIDKIDHDNDNSTIKIDYTVDGKSLVGEIVLKKFTAKDAYIDCLSSNNNDGVNEGDLYVMSEAPNDQIIVDILKNNPKALYIIFKNMLYSIKDNPTKPIEITYNDWLGIIIGDINPDNFIPIRLTPEKIKVIEASAGIYTKDEKCKSIYYNNK